MCQNGNTGRKNAKKRKKKTYIFVGHGRCHLDNLGIRALDGSLRLDGNRLGRSRSAEDLSSSLALRGESGAAAERSDGASQNREFVRVGDSLLGFLGGRGNGGGSTIGLSGGVVHLSLARSLRSS